MISFLYFSQDHCMIKQWQAKDFEKVDVLFLFTSLSIKTWQILFMGYKKDFFLALLYFQFRAKSGPLFCVGGTWKSKKIGSYILKAYYWSVCPLIQTSFKESLFVIEVKKVWTKTNKIYSLQTWTENTFLMHLMHNIVLPQIHTWKYCQHMLAATHGLLLRCS